jgi:hypothetical protein
MPKSLPFTKFLLSPSGEFFWNVEHADIATRLFKDRGRNGKLINFYDIVLDTSFAKFLRKKNFAWGMYHRAINSLVLFPNPYPSERQIKAVQDFALENEMDFEIETYAGSKIKYIAEKMTFKQYFLLESAASPFLKFYKTIGNGDWKTAHVPDDACLWECLHALEFYYEDFLRWYEANPKRCHRPNEERLIQDFQKRLTMIKVALRSNDVQLKMRAIDDGINQWHIDFPVIAHLEIDETGDFEHHKPVNKDFNELYSILKSLGKFADKSPYISDKDKIKTFE